ncbi:MAG: UbiA-like polyprenyltransferase [Thermodesulfobacteriota bacterium]|nr:UbiA-like polyprenyltransferase [Thermodesulfobacteriota bacterium]
MIKFEHTVFALPLAYVGAIIGAGGWPGIWNSTFILLTMVGARSAALSFNRLADHQYDVMNLRTRGRELPAGALSRRAVIWFMSCSIILFFLSAIALGRWCFYLAPPALMIILGYSYTKRFTWASHIWLGLALSLAPIGGFLAVTGRIELPVVVVAGGVLFWVAGFDIIYACQDEDFDRRIGLHSIPAEVGARLALHISSFFHLVSFILFLIGGALAHLTWPYFVAALIVGLLMIWEHLLVGPDRIEGLDTAFFTINSYVSITLLAGVIIATFLL